MAEYAGLREYLKCCDYKFICNHNTSNILASASPLQFFITTHDNDNGVADIRYAISPPVVNTDNYDSPVSTTSTITTPNNNNNNNKITQPRQQQQRSSPSTNHRRQRPHQHPQRHPTMMAIPAMMTSMISVQ